ncbi:MAG: hypothetical protein JNM80_13700 [Phycisphaerae bacterium]|nr:hypothetical protein [Phycisphaerae bacterium]
MSYVRRTPSCLVAVAGLALCSSAFGQAAPPPSQDVAVNFDSGKIFERSKAAPMGQEPMRVWSQEVTVPGSPWMRIHFTGDTVLAGPNRREGGSTLTITSLRDGSTQYFDAISLPEWSNTSAIFNGDTVRVELWAVPGAGENRVRIDNVIAGIDLGGPDTICGATDDRVPWNEPRVARMTTGCTGWLISRNGAANEALSAGHCISNGQAGVLMLFNVPPSTAAGALVAPPVEFQFPIQTASIQSVNPAAVGEEFSRFNMNNNSNTGLSPRVAQGRGAYTLASSAPTGGTAATTVRGFGVVNDQAGIPAVPAQWMQINKTHTAAYAGRAGNRINYVTDTDGGNSGSPVTQFIGSPIAFEQAIGIHTDGFCPGTFNSGTAIDQPDLQAALNAPAGTALAYDASAHRALSTTFASNNGGSDGGSIFFDVVTGTHNLEVEYFLLNINRTGATNNGTTTEDDDFFNFTVYLRPGTAAGFETNAAAWTQVATGAGMPKFEDEGTLGALKNTFTLAGSSSYGVAIVFDAGAGHAYTNADGSNETYSNADLSITGISASNTAFGSNIPGRVFNGAIGYHYNDATGQCLETLYAQNNGGSNGGMVYFDVVVGSLPVTLTGINTNLDGAGGNAANLTVFRKTGTAVGFENNAAAWTQVATGSATSQPVDTPTTFPLSTFVTLNANTTYGFALQATNGAGSIAHRYTNGNGLNQTYQDDRLRINTGSASNAPFTGNIPSRVWNGSFCYGVSLAPCAQQLFANRPPNPNISPFNSVPGGQEEADNFSVGANWAINNLTVWGSYSSTATPPDTQNFIVRVFGETGGLPGALVATRTINNVPALDTGLFVGAFNRPIYQYNITPAVINLTPGNYWLSVLGNDPAHTWAWARTNTLANAHAVRQGAGAWGLSAGDFGFVLCGVGTPPNCYANCDQSTVSPILNVNDFVCFQNAFAAGQSYANCDNSTIPPVLNVNDFVCFQNRFAAGCS